MSKLQSFGLFLGRLCMSAIFLWAGVGKILDYQGTADFMKAEGVTMIPFFLIGAMVVELVGGLSLALGYKTRFGATILLLFLIPTTYIFHDFWNVDEANRQMQTIFFLHNLALFGGLLYVLSCGPGGCSCDCCCRKREAEIP